MQFGRSWQWKLGECTVFIGTVLAGVSNNSLAQVVPDSTLGGERSIVTPNVMIRGIDSDLVDGGAIRGANLFHSFSQFSIGGGAYFTNLAGIGNILSRVTGANRSEILGRRNLLLLGGTS